MYDWLNTGIWIEHRSPSRLFFFFFSLMQLMSFVAVHIDSAFVTQEKKLSDACVCCMKRCHSLDKRRWSACITALGAARLGLWCADHHLRLGYDSIIQSTSFQWKRSRHSSVSGLQDQKIEWNVFLQPKRRGLFFVKKKKLSRTEKVMVVGSRVSQHWGQQSSSSSVGEPV